MTDCGRVKKINSNSSYSIIERLGKMQSLARETVFKLLALEKLLC